MKFYKKEEIYNIKDPQYENMEFIPYCDVQELIKENDYLKNERIPWLKDQIMKLSKRIRELKSR